MELKDLKGTWIDTRTKEEVRIKSIRQDKGFPKDCDYWVIYDRGDDEQYARAWAFGVTDNPTNVNYVISKESNVRRILDKIK